MKCILDWYSSSGIALASQGLQVLSWLETKRLLLVLLKVYFLLGFNDFLDGFYR